ncbi:MAG: ABC transporter ATP-binding protein [Pseudomonadales bacterium]|nr:ABC transporter ATP-binding protein [Pseudomonadales bacterium]
MIEFIDVSKYYPTKKGRKFVFKSLNIKLPENKNIGVLGLNGSGKSTLLRMIAGTDYPNKGVVSVKGSVSWPLGLSGGTQGSMTGRENAEFVCRIHGDYQKQINEKLEFILDFSELGDYFDLPVKSYSSGMRSRLLFGISMAFDFDIYLIDEITAVGDLRFRKKSQEALMKKREKSNFIMVSHNVNDLIKECDHLLIIDKGNVSLFHDNKEGLSFYHQALNMNSIK